MTRSQPILSALLAIALLLVTSCGGDDDLKNYLRSADASFETVRNSQSKLQDSFGSLPRLNDPQFFTAMGSASEGGANLAEDALAGWELIKPASDARAFHQRVTDDLKRLKKLYEAVGGGAKTKSYEKLFQAYADFPALFSEFDALNRQWMELGKKANFNVSKIEAKLKNETPDAAAKREYLFLVLPHLGTTLDVELKLGGGFGAFDAGFSDRLAAFAAPLNESMTRARASMTSLKPPAGAEQAHRDVTAAVEAVQLLTRGLEEAGRQKSMRAFTEAYRPLGNLLTTNDLDCSWRQLVAASGVGGDPGSCAPLPANRKADVEYAFGAFVVIGGFIDSLNNLTPKSPKTPTEFIEYATALSRAATTGQKDAAPLRATSNVTFNDNLTSFLNDLQREADALAQAFRASNSPRAQTAASAITELLTVRLRSLSADFDAMFKASIRR